MSVLTPLQDMGVMVVLTETGRLKLQGSNNNDQAVVDMAIEYARNHKPAIIAALSQKGELGQCESCPAAGYWDQSLYAGQGLLCFHTAYYLHKSGRPKPCIDERNNCPRLNNELPSPSGRR